MLLANMSGRVPVDGLMASAALDELYKDTLSDSDTSSDDETESEHDNNSDTEDELSDTSSLSVNSGTPISVQHLERICSQLWMDRNWG